MNEKKKKGRAADITRYILIGVLVVLAVLLVIIMFNVYNSAVREINDSNVVVVEDTESATEAVEESESETETEAVMETGETRIESAAEDHEETESESDTENQQIPETDAASETPGETESEQAEESHENTETDAAAETRADEDVREETGAIYLTLNSDCNFRSEASYTDANGNDTVITSYPAGTVVEFLEDVGGWYKVRINGVVGYMGAKFFD